MTTHSKPQMIQSDNGSEFTNREFRQYLMELNIEQKFGLPYHPKSQGAVESFNKTIQKILEMAKYHQKNKFDLEDSVNDFLFYYNNRKHSTTQVAPYTVMSNMNNLELIDKVTKMTVKSRGKSKVAIELLKKESV